MLIMLFQIRVQYAFQDIVIQHLPIQIILLDVHSNDQVQQLLLVTIPSGRQPTLAHRGTSSVHSCGIMAWCSAVSGQQSAFYTSG